MNSKSLFKLYCGVILVWIVRIAYTHTFRSGYVVWNLFLAFIPLLIMRLYSLLEPVLQGTVRKIVQVGLAASWLLFLPNSFYILTDFMHLNYSVLVNERGDTAYYAANYIRGDGLYVLDSLLLFLATALGAYVGGLVLIRAYRYMSKHYSILRARSIIGLIVVLSSIGVFIGRFGRWNSWDAIVHPLGVMSDFWQSITSSAGGRRFGLVFVSICLLQLASMYVVGLSYKQKS
jgi:uncharacterized membrane protein